MAQTLRTMALGGWGEEKASILLKRAGFRSVRNLNSEIPNHLFADIYAERNNERFIIGVKTRNRQTAEGKLNSCYNIRKKGKDLRVLAIGYKAHPAWVAIQVEAEKQRCSAFFGTVAQIMFQGERYSIPMTPQATSKYELLASDEHDPTIRPEWSNRKNP
jgi:Holliday junction resolvase